MEDNRPSKLRQLWNRFCGRHPYENKKGEITTRHGNTILPKEIEISDEGGVSWTNFGAYISQPRGRELLLQIEAGLKGTPRNEGIHLDRATGRFYLRSAFQAAADKAVPLGEIDVEVETDLFTRIRDIAVGSHMFGRR